MYIAQIVIMTVILSYMSMTSSFMTTSALDLVKGQKQTKDMTMIEEGVLLYFDENGVLPGGFTDITPYLSYVSMNGWKDADGADFEIIDNGGVPFSHLGVNTYIAAIVAPGKNGLDSTIAANTLVVNDNEVVYLIPQEKFDSGFRGTSFEAISYCNNASILFAAANGGSNPANLTDLTVGGYLNPNYAFDGRGNLLIATGGSCYSRGWNGIDEAGAGDDLS